MQEITGRQPRTLEQWTRAHADAFRCVWNKVIVVEPSFIKTSFADHASFADHSDQRASLYGAFDAQARRFFSMLIWQIRFVPEE